MSVYGADRAPGSGGGDTARRFQLCGRLCYQGGRSLLLMRVIRGTVEVSDSRLVTFTVVAVDSLMYEGYGRRRDVADGPIMPSLAF